MKQFDDIGVFLKVELLDFAHIPEFTLGDSISIKTSEFCHLRTGVLQDYWPKNGIHVDSESIKQVASNHELNDQWSGLALVTQEALATRRGDRD